MYKDKPYATSARRPKWWKRKRILGSFMGLGMLLLWAMGMFEGEHGGNKSIADKLDWIRKPETKGRIDWGKRRDKVVDAFTLSWDAYKRYAWGESIMSTWVWVR